MRTYVKEIKHSFTIALSFGFFRGVMPIIGWLAGVGVIVESVRCKERLKYFKFTTWLNLKYENFDRLTINVANYRKQKVEQRRSVAIWCPGA